MLFIIKQSQTTSVQDNSHYADFLTRFISVYHLLFLHCNVQKPVHVFISLTCFLRIWKRSFFDNSCYCWNECQCV